MKQAFIASLVSATIIVFVFLFLNITTNHNNYISVPDLKGFLISDVEEILKKNDLNFEVSDSTFFNPNFPKFSVLEQIPNASSKVKKNRKIYLTINPSNYRNVAIPDSYHLQAIEKTEKYLKKHFGKIDIILGDLQRHIKGNVNLPVSGLDDMIAPSDVVGYKNGRLKAVSGESYIMLIQFSNDAIEIETILPYGNSNNPDSPHYTDQMIKYINKETKLMTLDKEKIL